MAIVLPFAPEWDRPPQMLLKLVDFNCAAGQPSNSSCCAQPLQGGTVSTKRMGITKKAVAATAIALGLAAANAGSAGAAGYPEYVTFNNQHFDVN
ncbi:hypothetical protein ACFQ69_17685 [Streptomyces sp. NPDC056470]|uniref:hypothetical protein n=1 Tax=Streptomyces sp. NPDC056470 TaxID=3345831 RepID=UPI003687C09A